MARLVLFLICIGIASAFSPSSRAVLARGPSSAIGLRMQNSDPMRSDYSGFKSVREQMSLSSTSASFNQANFNSVQQDTNPTSAAGETPLYYTVKKMLPQALMFFCILFNYTILRDTKDVLVVTAPKSGAEIIPFLKTYVQLPASIAFTIIYSSLCNRMSQEKVFYTVVTPFLAFFASFATIIYPNRGFLHPNAAADALTLIAPAFFYPLIAIFRNWTYAMFYMFAELWGSCVASLLFWGFANEINTVSEAKKFYPLFGLVANVALIFSGQYVKFVSHLRSGLPAGVDKWGHSLKLLMGGVVAGGVAMMGLYEFVQRQVLTDPQCVDPEREKNRKKSKPKLTMKESAAFLSKSTYIRDLALLVIGYGMSINIVEVTWKSKLKVRTNAPISTTHFPLGPLHAHSFLIIRPFSPTTRTGGLPRPQCVQRLYGQFLLCHRSRHPHPNARRPLHLQGDFKTQPVDNMRFSFFPLRHVSRQLTPSALPLIPTRNSSFDL